VIGVRRRVSIDYGRAQCIWRGGFDRFGPWSTGLVDALWNPFAQGRAGELVQRSHGVLRAVDALDAPGLLRVGPVGGEQAGSVEVQERVEELDADLEGELFEHLSDDWQQMRPGEGLHAGYHLPLGHAVHRVDVIQPLYAVLITLVDAVDADEAGSTAGRRGAAYADGDRRRGASPGLYPEPILAGAARRREVGRLTAPVRAGGGGV